MKMACICQYWQMICLYLKYISKPQTQMAWTFVDLQALMDRHGLVLALWPQEGHFDSVHNLDSQFRQTLVPSSTVQVTDA